MRMLYMCRKYVDMFALLVSWNEFAGTPIEVKLDGLNYDMFTDGTREVNNQR
jgi:hypothetical protein